MFIIDFDDTLFDTRVGYEKARVKSLNKLGISKKQYRATYLQVRAQGKRIVYNHFLHARALARLGFEEKKVYAVFKKFESKKFLQKFLFNESITFLKQLQKFGEKMILLSAGDKKFQAAKFKALRLEKYFNDIVIASTNKGKVLRKIIKTISKEKIWFINDKVAETLELKKRFSRPSYLLKRAKIYPLKDYQKSGLPYFTNLIDVYEYIRKNK